MANDGIAAIIDKYADNMRIVWDDENMKPVRELVFVGGIDCWETRWIDGFKRIISTDNFNEALLRLIHP